MCTRDQEKAKKALKALKHLERSMRHQLGGVQPGHTFSDHKSAIDKLANNVDNGSLITDEMK
jgi:hypothetical protein